MTPRTKKILGGSLFAAATLFVAGLAVGTSVGQSAFEARLQGREEGHRDGFVDGYAMGWCTATLNLTAEEIRAEPHRGGPLATCVDDVEAQARREGF